MAARTSTTSATTYRPKLHVEVKPGVTKDYPISRAAHFEVFHLLPIQKVLLSHNRRDQKTSEPWPEHSRVGIHALDNAI